MEGQKVGQQQGVRPFRVAVLLQVEDVEVLAVAVAVKVPIGVVEGNGLSVFRQQGFIVGRGQGLPEGGAVLEGEPRGSQRVAHGPPRIAAGTLVSFIHENQVVALKGFHRYAVALAPLLHHQLGNLGDFHSPGSVQQTGPLVEVETFGGYVGCPQFLKVLPAQPFVGRDQQDVVQRLAVMVQELPVVQVQQQRLAAARGHPERHLPQVGGGEFPMAFTGRASAVVSLHEPVQRPQQGFGMGAVAVKVDFRRTVRPGTGSSAG